jgi:uncharacterized HAD superfamily protein
MNIAFDLDGVLADILTPFCEVLNNGFDLELTPESFPDYSLVSHLPVQCMTAGTILLRGSDPVIYKKAKPFDGAGGVIERLSKNHNVYIVTSRPNKIAELTGEFVYSHFPSITDVIYARKKGDVLRGLRCRMFIDDYYRNVNEVAEHRILSYLLSRPYNRSASLLNTRYAKKATDLEDFENKVAELSAQGGI